jgi:PAS domain-containing protein
MKLLQKIKHSLLNGTSDYPPTGIKKTNGKQIENALQEDNSHFTQLVANLPAAIYTCDASGFITMYNKAAAELWGREPEIGKDLWCGSWKIYKPDGITPLPFDECPNGHCIERTPTGSWKRNCY